MSSASPSDRAIGDTRTEGAEPYIAHLAAFIEHTSQGNHRAAIAAAQAARDAAPRRPETHFALGEALHDSGQVAAAELSFREAIQLAPRWADAWIMLGACRYRQDAIWEAKGAMRQAHRIAPNNPAAAANLALFMRLTGEAAEAEAILRRTIAAAPDNAGARLNLAADLLQEERPDEALALLDAAPSRPTEPSTLRHWYLQRSLALLHLRRPAEARPELEALAAMGPIPPDIAPLCLWRYVLLAMYEGDMPSARRTAAAMGQALETMGPDAAPELRIMAHYDLAWFWSRDGQPAAAFGLWRQAHTLLRHIQPFGRDRQLAAIDAKIAAFPASRFVDGPLAANNDPTPVFIVGMPRSGTTLCEQIIAAHPLAFGAGERTAVSQLSWRLGDPATIAAMDRPTLDTVAGAFLAELHALAPDKARIVDKMPGNYLHIGTIALLMPGARFIHCTRDPRDIGLSIFTFRFHGEHGYAHDLGDLGWTIAQQDRLMRHWKEVLPGRILTVRLNDWIEDFDATLRRVSTHLDLPYDPACERFYEQDTRVRTVSRSQVRQPVNARGIGRWKAYEAELQPAIAELEQAGMLAEWSDGGR